MIRVIRFGLFWKANRWLAPAILVVALLGSVAPQAAVGAESFALSKVEAPSSVCGVCMAIRVPTAPAGSADAVGPDLEGGGELGGYDSKELREAYKTPETGGSTQTVAVVDAYNDPYAESDLQEYRKKYGDYFKGTETACTEANGCFKKIDQAGETAKEAEEHGKTFPETSSGWSGEISLDIDMVSAACPECHILLVEASNEELASLSAANEEAVTKKATETSNSWGVLEFSGETSDDKYFDHPGIPTFAAAGDVQYNGCDHKHGAGICYPAASPYVIAVGGTELRKEPESSRKWTEAVWKEETELRASGTGGGCSKYEPKPPGQKELPANRSYCEHRIDNDVAADAAVESAVSVYDSYYGGWEDFGGTSAASPFVAGVEAHATSATKLLGAEAFYKKPSMVFDVTKGNSGSCIPPTEDEYFCTAEVGYDGPTGEGTPDNVFESIVAAGATGFATRVGGASATLDGTVNPNGATTKYYFQYGLTESFGSKTEEVNVGSGTSNLEESKGITGLKGNTKYYFRIVTTNSNGTTYGLNQVFTTLVAPPENTVLPVASPETPDQAVPEATTNGTWTNEPTGYAYQWERCNATGSECGNITGATGSTYTPIEADVGHTLRVKVTAKNPGGEGTATSGVTKKIEAIGKITEYSLPKNSCPNQITTGPDGNIWFTEYCSDKIGKITPEGKITEFSSCRPSGITAGPDGNVWFTCGETVGKITPSGTITEYKVNARSGSAIVTGPEGNLWFTTMEEDVDKITPSGAVTEYKALPKGHRSFEISSGDGDLWVTDDTIGGKLWKVSPEGIGTEYAVREATDGVAVGPEKDIWFNERNQAGNR